jgi:hypothetical protein
LQIALKVRVGPYAIPHTAVTSPKLYAFCDRLHSRWRSPSQLVQVNADTLLP